MRLFRTLFRVSLDAGHPRAAHDRCAVTTYPVIWSYFGEGWLRSGRLEVHRHRIALHGGSGTDEVHEQLDPSEIEQIRRLPHAERLAHLPSLQIDRRIGPPLLLAATAGVGAFSEMLDKLCSVIV